MASEVITKRQRTKPGGPNKSKRLRKGSPCPECGAPLSWTDRLIDCATSEAFVCTKGPHLWTRDGEPVESVLPLRAPSEATPVATESDAEPARSGLAAEARRRLCTQLHRLHADWGSVRDLDDPWGADMDEVLIALALAAEDDGTVLQGVVHSSPSATATSPGTVDAEPLDLKPWLRSAADEARKLRERPIGRSAPKGQGRARRPRHPRRGASGDGARPRRA